MTQDNAVVFFYFTCVMPIIILILYGSKNHVPEHYLITKCRILRNYKIFRLDTDVMGDYGKE